MNITKILDSIPNLFSIKEVEAWIEKQLIELKQMQNKDLFQAPFFAIDWSMIARDVMKETIDRFGFSSSPIFQKFLLSLFFADIACYEKVQDQVDFARLHYILNKYPEGFCVYFIFIDNTYFPVGYTGFYPMLENTFKLFKEFPETISSRFVEPNLNKDETTPILYLFNYSVIASCKKSFLSRTLIKNFVAEIEKKSPKDLSCITVSEDGERIAKRLNLSLRGQFFFEGSVEHVYTT